MYLVTLVFGIVLLGALPASAGVDTVLDADFDAKAVNSPIGTGGPEVDEPIYAGGGVCAYVRSTPFATPSLEIRDASSLFGDSVRFQFLNGYELAAGTVVLSATLWFDSRDNYAVWAYSPNTGPMRRYTELRFQADGSILYLDEDTTTATQVGTYSAGQSYALVVTQRLDTGDYDVTLGGTPLLTGESHGVTDEGLGAFGFSAWADADTNGQMSVDDVLVTTTDLPTPVTPTSWAAIKGAYLRSDR